MNYQTGDYIRFHTPEQWQQIAEKLERDGQEVYGDHFKQNTKAFYLDRDSTWYRVYSYEDYLPEATEDITDKFFEEILQDELCNNPPLEVGDELVVKWDICEKEFKFKKLAECDRYDIDWVDELGDTQYYTHTYDLEKLLNQDIIKILSYKQANPVQEDWRVCRMKKCEYDFKDGDVFIATSELSRHSCECVVEGLEVVMKAAGYGFTDLSVSLKDMVNEIEQERITITNYQAACKIKEVENTFNNILAVNRSNDYVETVSVFSDHSEATFYYWKDCEVVGDVTLNKIELQHYVEKLQKMLSDMD